jgi:hypothetical protein
MTVSNLMTFLFQRRLMMGGSMSGKGGMMSGSGSGYYEYSYYSKGKSMCFFSRIEHTRKGVLFLGFAHGQ